MRYNSDDTYYWYCVECDRRWEHDPLSYYCEECEYQGYKAKILPFTREDWKNKKAELDMDSQKENE